MQLDQRRAGASGGDQAAELMREGDYWTVAFDGRELRIRDSKGIRYLAELLSRPGVEVTALELVGGESDERLPVAEANQASLSSGGESDVGPTLDVAAKTAYRRRLEEIEEEIEQARAFHDPERAERARAEYDAVARELASAVGLGRRDRRAGSPAERARLNATRAIKAALERISDHDAALADYLTANVLTGRVCVYRPDARGLVRWHVRTRPPRAPLARRFQEPDTRYARSGDLSIAYQVLGDGPIDLVLVPGWLSHLDFQWTDPTFTSWLRGFATFSRLIMYDMRGTGLSDPIRAAPTLEERMDDIHAVMDAVGSERTALFGLSQGGPIAALFAATYPERAAGLVLYGTFPAGPGASGRPFLADWGDVPARCLAAVDTAWGRGDTLDVFAPSLGHNKLMCRAWGMFERASMSPSMARDLLDFFQQVDVRAALGAIGVPTLVLHRTGDVVPIAAARYLAEHIPGARFAELPGGDHAPITGDTQAIVDAVEEFVADLPDERPAEYVLASVLVLEATDPSAGIDSELIRDRVTQAGGVIIEQTTNGVTARFDGPVRAIRCGFTTLEDARSHGLSLRAGVHAGECELSRGGLRGIAMQIAAAVSARAAPGETLVTGTVRDLVLGSGTELTSRGTCPIAQAPGDWPVFAVTGIPEGSTTHRPRDDHIPLVDRAAHGVVHRTPATARATMRVVKRGK